MFCPKSMAAQDAYVHSLAQRLDLFGDDGVYLDGTVSSPPCRNTMHGCGYSDGGSLRTTYPVFAARAFMKRLYHTVKQRDPEGLLDVHCSFGYNPAALAYADIGIALGSRGTDIAIETADVTIAGEDPLKIPALIQISRHTMNIVRQNFAVAVGVNTLGIVLGALGYITPMAAAVLHNMTTVGVVINSTRLLVYKPR